MGTTIAEIGAMNAGVERPISARRTSTSARTSCASRGSGSATGTTIVRICRTRGIVRGNAPRTSSGATTGRAFRRRSSATARRTASTSRTRARATGPCRAVRRASSSARVRWAGWGAPGGGAC
uniref:(northern house mosquito) hypothetical protein n=1 Tax=Culex pipiens TaxID=7175 RepID=A0A8D8C7P9_CULPI